MSNEVISRIEISRKELLDLGLRNPLINFRQRAKQVKVVDELSAEIYRLLVLENRKMSFDALPEKKMEELIQNENGEQTDISSVDWEDLLTQPDEELENGDLAARYLDNKLQTNLTSKKLQTKLLSIRNDSRTYIEEQGVNILYIALGFLHWYEASSSKEPRRAPLILIPVELMRTSAQKRFQVLYTGEDIGDNLSLIEKLKTEFNIKFPTIGNADDLDVDKYFQLVSDSIKSDDRWSVENNEITLGFFSFGKFLMYKDLDPETWSDGLNGDGFNILESLLTEGFREKESDYDDEVNIDDVVSPEELNQVKDADSTQTIAILDSISGRNFVLQGPPGTGKSQTITNIIAEGLGRGRKVLFVSEKMAALDVVKRRLDEVGLGDAVLELHSHKTNKKQVLAELKRTLSQGKPLVSNLTDDINTLKEMRDKLNAYSTAVNAPIGKTRTSFINALGNALKTIPQGIDEQPFNFEPMQDWTESDYRSSRLKVETLARHISETGPPKKNPFKVCNLTEFLPSQRPKLEQALEKGLVNTKVLISKAIKLADEMGLEKPVKRSEVGIICRAARRAMEAPHLEGLVLTSGEWQARRDDISKLISTGKKLRQAHAQYDEWLIDEAWEQDLIAARQSYVTKGVKWWRIFSGEYRSARSKMQGLCRQPLQKEIPETIQMIDTILDSQKHQKQFNELSDLGSSLFGAQWKKEESDWEVLEKLTEWVVKLYNDLGNGDVPEGIIHFLSGSPEVNQLKEKLEEVELNYEHHQMSIESIADMLQLQIPEDKKIEWNLSLEKQALYLNHWKENLDKLFSLIRFNQLKEEFIKSNLGFIIDTSKSWEHDGEKFTQLFDYSWFNGLVEKAYIESDEIKLFDRTNHTHILEEFSRLDMLIFNYNQAKLALKHWKSLPKMSSGGELHIINREINKKRRIMPIRKLISDAGRAIQAIKPVFMMSPMSIATYVPQGSVQFDLVVFDEASQVKPVDAFGAIIRAKQAIVVGDSKQLPPTSFFDSLVESDDEDDYDNVGDTESILSLFLGKGSPERMLRWHYRSRHDSLIAVSNNEFYNNRLVVFPSPGVKTSARGLRFHHLPDTSYERGKTRSNPKEARAVAKAVIAHAKKYPDLTLGVVAFSTAQRDAIGLQLELLRRLDLECEPFFDEAQREPFFIKNLENVQGDERDVIFISIGYGKTSEGYMAMSFGPLNRDGGERRLNVLISRAKLAMDVFANFTGDDIDLNRTKARGAIALKNFLNYAQTGILQMPYATGKEPDSPFEEEVIKALVQSGYDVEPQVGTAGFFIDIGVKDRNQPGRYIIGIECDGAAYHSSLSARDRDRLRQQVLEGLGWRLHRIWSTDWYRNPEKELERTLSAIQRAEEDLKNGLVIKNIPENTNDGAGNIEREERAEEETHRDNTINYETYVPEIYLYSYELHELPIGDLFSHIYKIVKVESPIHKTELIHRIIEGAGLKRSGRRIKKAVQNSIDYGVRKNEVCQRGDFIWDSSVDEPKIRNRSELSAASKKFEFVAPEEIKCSIYQEVEKSFSLTEDDAISQSARSLGFQRVTTKAQNIFFEQLKQMINEGTLVLNNGLLTVFKVQGNS